MTAYLSANKNADYHRINENSWDGIWYLQAVLFLEVMNWYDGFIIDEIWVRFSKFWVIPGLEDMDYVQSWTQMFMKRQAFSHRPMRRFPV